MSITWIAVGHRSGALIFESRGPRRPLEVVEKLENPEGRLKESEIDADRPGISFERAGPGQHAMSRSNSAVDGVAEQFARKVAAVLEAGRIENRFQRLAVVAEPRFLGRLRSAMSDATQSLVVVSVDKNLPHADGEGLRKLLADELLV